MRAINATIMRHVNRTLILDNIRMRPISRAELAEETGLTRASVTQIVDELIGEGLVVEGSMIGRSRLGRRSTLLAINAGAGAFFGVSLDKDQCTVGMIDLHGRVMRQNTELMAGRKPEEVVNAVAAIMKMQLHCSGTDRAQIFGIGMSVPGPADSAAGVLLNSCGMEEWKGVPIAKMLAERTRMPVYLETAAGAQALEEKYFGENGDTFLLVRAAETLSIAAVVEGSLYHGRRDFAVELGGCPADMTGESTLDENHSVRSLLQTAGYRTVEELAKQCADGEIPVALVNSIGRGVASLMHAFKIPSVVLAGPMGRIAPLREQLNAAIRAAVRCNFESDPICAGTESDPVRAAASPAYHTLFHADPGALCERG